MSDVTKSPGQRAYEAFNATSKAFTPWEKVTTERQLLWETVAHEARPLRKGTKRPAGKHVYWVSSEYRDKRNRTVIRDGVHYGQVDRWHRPRVVMADSSRCTPRAVYASPLLAALARLRIENDNLKGRRQSVRGGERAVAAAEKLVAAVRAGRVPK